MGKVRSSPGITWYHLGAKVAAMVPSTSLSTSLSFNSCLLSVTLSTLESVVSKSQVPPS